MSKSTVISLVPFPISEFKPGIYPGFFEVGACNNQVPQLLVVGDSMYHVEIDENRTISVKCPSDDIAKSIVEDYLVANLAYSPEEDVAPGIFWKPGVYDIMGIQTKFEADLKYHRDRQNRWFKKLVEMGDDDWEKTRQHKAISDVQRYAAKALKLSRPWIIPVVADQAAIIRCPACKAGIDPEAIVCQFCRCIINMDQYKKLQFAQEAK